MLRTICRPVAYMRHACSSCFTRHELTSLSWIKRPECRSFTDISTRRSPKSNDSEEYPSPLLQPAAQHVRKRRQAMTTSEINTFNDMFNMIFDAVSEQKEAIEDVELKRDNMGDLFARLRQNSKQLKWTTEEEDVLDRKKEEMELCDTDQQLLKWAMDNVFDESVRLEAESRKAIKAAEQSGQVQSLPRLQSSAYPHILAILMKTFRDRYKDPHLALALFDHARNLSIVSYVFGCTTPAYNELIITRWMCLRDLKGVHDALQEMATNGISFDAATRKIVDDIRHEVGTRNLWTEEDPLGGGEVWSLLKKIEELVNKSKKSKGKKPRVSTSEKNLKPWNDWKNMALEDSEDDAHGFDKWDEIALQKKRR